MYLCAKEICTHELQCEYLFNCSILFLAFLRIDSDHMYFLSYCYYRKNNFLLWREIWKISIRSVASVWDLRLHMTHQTGCDNPWLVVFVIGQDGCGLWRQCHTHCHIEVINGSHVFAYLVSFILHSAPLIKLDIYMNTIRSGRWSSLKWYSGFIFINYKMLTIGCPLYQ